jgi:hypothetical protein
MPDIVRANHRATLVAIGGRAAERMLVDAANRQRAGRATALG